jgi:hypothetical protein
MLHLRVLGTWVEYSALQLSHSRGLVQQRPLFFYYTANDHSSSAVAKLLPPGVIFCWRNILMKHSLSPPSWCQIRAFAPSHPFTQAHAHTRTLCLAPSIIATITHRECGRLFLQKTRPHNYIWIIYCNSRRKFVITNVVYEPIHRLV